MKHPPKAKKIRTERLIHGETLVDEYDWLRDPNWPRVEDEEVLGYLRAENAHVEHFFEEHSALVDQVYKEILGRVKLADKSVPIKGRNHWYYFSVTQEDSNYATHMRHDESGREELILDEEAEAKGHEYFRVGTMAINPTGKLMAYSYDTKGDEHYSVVVRDLSSSSLFKDKLENVIGSIVWREDSKGFYYTKVDDKWRANELYYHALGTEQAEDILLYKETDYTYSISLGKTSSYKYVLVGIKSSNSNEVRYIESSDESHTLNMFIPRREDHLYQVDHFQGHFYITTNDAGKNFRLVRTTKPNMSEYEEIVPHSDEVYLTGVNLYNNFIVIETREHGLPKISLLDYDLNPAGGIDFPDPTYSAGVIDSALDDDGVVIGYSSLVSPSTVFKYDFKTKQLVVKKVQEIPSGYDPALYKSERLYIDSREDGIRIPVSLVYRKDLFKHDGTNALFLYGYGSYGMAIPPSFRSSVLSVLDRGFVYAVAHIRGGDDLGYKWYESAKFLNKKRTFNDFIDVAQGLIKLRYTSEGNIAIHGGSAGGMLIASVLNEAPHLFKAAIADVPFVDVLNTMLDDKLPLTPGEYKEWGNPMNEEYFHYIRSYSPYDNVRAQAYPHLYVLAGLNDPRVTYWEPAKWVAKLRDMRTNDNLLIFETDMSTGHGGSSRRFEQYKELARKYVFVLGAFNT
jgi:oligopeptidase B